MHHLISKVHHLTGAVHHLEKKFCLGAIFLLAVTKNTLYLHCQNGSALKQKAMTTQMTIREIRRVLFDRDIYTVIGADEMSNKESRDLLYSIDDQEKMMNVIDNTSHLLIWN